MRLWLRDSERRPDPVPARADARKAVLAGTTAWLVAIAVAVVFRDALGDAGLDWLIWAGVAGAFIGLVGLLAVQVSRRLAARQDAGSSG